MRDEQVACIVMSVMRVAGPHRDVDVHAAAGLVGKGLGHHRKHHVLGLSQHVRRLLEQHQVVGAGQHLVGAEINFKLAMRASMGKLQHVQAASFKGLLQRLQISALSMQAPQIMTWIAQPVGVVGR